MKVIMTSKMSTNAMMKQYSTCSFSAVLSISGTQVRFGVFGRSARTAGTKEYGYSMIEVIRSEMLVGLGGEKSDGNSRQGWDDMWLIIWFLIDITWVIGMQILIGQCCDDAELEADKDWRKFNNMKWLLTLSKLLFSLKLGFPFYSDRHNYDYQQCICSISKFTVLQLEEIQQKMGCEASQAVQPPPTPHRTLPILSLPPKKPKTLYRGFCFGSKTIQLYSSGPHCHSTIIQPICEQSNESQTYIPLSLATIPVQTD